MKRYMLFGFGDYDNIGGSQHFVNDFDNLEQICSYFELIRENSINHNYRIGVNLHRPFRYWDIIDLKTKITINRDDFKPVLTNKRNSKHLMMFLKRLNFPKELRKLIYSKIQFPIKKDRKTGLKNYIIDRKIRFLSTIK